MTQVLGSELGRIGKQKVIADHLLMHNFNGGACRIRTSCVNEREFDMLAISTSAFIMSASIVTSITSRQMQSATACHKDVKPRVL